MSYSLTTFFVVPVGNSLPTTGSTETLTLGQFGIYKDNARTAATAGNVSTANFIQLAQGRPNIPPLNTKLSDKIKSTKIKKLWKVIGQSTASVQITELTDFTGQCDETLTVSFRLHSYYVDTISFNGLTRSVTVQLPCCDCGADPCEEIGNEVIIDLILAKIAQMEDLDYDSSAIRLSSFLSFNKTGTGTSAKLIVSGKPLTVYGDACDIAAFPFQLDRMWFRAFAYAGPATTVDFFTYDNCAPSATVTVAQRSGFPQGTSTEIEQMQKDYYSYQSIHKHLYSDSAYNPYFEDYVTDGTTYDIYWIQFDEYQQNDAWTANEQQDERVGIAIAAGAGATIETIIETYAGSSFEDSSQTIYATTTSTTSSSSTTSTTTLAP